MNALTITFCGRAMSPAQWLALTGVIRYCPECPNRWAPGMQSSAMSFDSLVTLAAQRGFTGRRLLKAAMRTGKVGPTALTRCEAVIALLQPCELMREVASASRVLKLASHRPQPQGRA